MSIWFEGRAAIRCSMRRVDDALADLGAYYRGVTELMPGMTSVELLDQGEDFITIRTNEGLMTRTNISRHADGDRVTVEFDEAYKAKSLTVTSHHVDEFTPSDDGITHRLTISGVEAPGLIGFFYRRFGSSNIGRAFMQAATNHLERAPG